MDLPAEDPDAGIDVYADVCVEAFDGLPDDIVIVGHSTGGLTLPVLAVPPARRSDGVPVRAWCRNRA